MRKTTSYMISIIFFIIVFLILGLFDGFEFFKNINLENALLTIFVGYYVVSALSDEDDDIHKSYDSGEGVSFWDIPPTILGLVADMIKDFIKAFVDGFKKLGLWGRLLVVFIFLSIFALILLGGL